jgi:hypothetical protein
MNIPDIEVLDQNGRKIHFYTDLVKGQTVVINFIFTTCTTICPPLGATFARVQKNWVTRQDETCASSRSASIRRLTLPSGSSVGREISCR